MDLSNRQQYLVWIELFMREIYELMLDESFKSLGTTSWDLTFGYLEHNASATGTFRATANSLPSSCLSPVGVVRSMMTLPLLNLQSFHGRRWQWLSAQPIAGW
jgi:hypothetical protein